MKKALITATTMSHIAQFHKGLIKEMHKRGYEVHVAANNNLSEKNGLSIEEADKIYDISISRSPIKISNLKAYFDLKKIIDENGYDLVHCNTPMGGVLTRIAARKKRNTQVVYMAHGFHFFKGAPLKNWLIYYPIEKFLCRYTDLLVTITNEDFLFARKKFNTKVEHIHGVGVNNERFYPKTKDIIKKYRQELDYDGLIVLCIGELLKNKNQETLIKAMRVVVNQYSDAKLLIAGNGPLKNYLLELVKNLELEKNVVFLGYRTDINKYIDLCDIVVSASFREGLPLNIMESMSSGKAIVVSKNRGHSELIKDGQNGYIVEPTDYNMFANKIMDIYSHNELREKFERNSIKFSSVYSMENIIDELNKFYWDFEKMKEQ